MRNNLAYQKYILQQNEKFQKSKDFRNLGKKTKERNLFNENEKITKNKFVQSPMSRTYYVQDLKKTLLCYQNGGKLEKKQ